MFQPINHSVLPNITKSQLITVTKSWLMYVSVLSGSEETKICVYTCGSWALHHRGMHHSSDLSFPLGLALGVELHPWVNITLLTLPYSLPFKFQSYLLQFLWHVRMQTGNRQGCDMWKRRNGTGDVEALTTRPRRYCFNFKICSSYKTNAEAKLSMSFIVVNPGTL